MTYTSPINGIDVSHWQGAVDWKTVRANAVGPGFAAWKVTEGLASVDPYKDNNRVQSALAGFRWRMGYHWLTPVDDAVAQANWFLAHFTSPANGEGVLLDAEQAGITAVQVLAFCQRVEAVLGRPVGVYTGIGVAGGTIWKSNTIFNGKRPRFLADYNPQAQVRVSAAPYGFDGWQGDGGATGHIPGVVGGCDLDYIEHPSMFDRACGISTATPPIPIFKGVSDVAIALLSPSDDPARFFAVVSAQGAAISAQWTGPGDDPKVQARILAETQAGMTQLPCVRANLINCRIEGPVPPGWSKADFSNLPGD